MLEFYFYTLLAGIVALLFAFWGAYSTLKLPEGNEKMKEIRISRQSR